MSYHSKLVSLNEELEIIKAEKRELDEIAEYITPIVKQLNDADPSDMPIKEYNQLVKEYKEFAEDYNQRAKVINDLVNNMKGAEIK